MAQIQKQFDNASGQQAQIEEIIASLADWIEAHGNKIMQELPPTFSNQKNPIPERMIFSVTKKPGAGAACAVEFLHKRTDYNEWRGEGYGRATRPEEIESIQQRLAFSIKIQEPKKETGNQASITVSYNKGINEDTPKGIQQVTLSYTEGYDAQEKIKEEICLAPFPDSTYNIGPYTEGRIWEDIVPSIEQFFKTALSRTDYKLMKNREVFNAPRLEKQEIGAPDVAR